MKPSTTKQHSPNLLMTPFPATWTKASKRAIYQQAQGTVRLLELKRLMSGSLKYRFANRFAK